MRALLALLVLLSACRLESGTDLEADPDSTAIEIPVLEDEVPVRDEAPMDSSDLDATGSTLEADDTRSDLEVEPGGLLIPVVGVPPSELVDTYRAARSEGRSHDAIDIMAPRGRMVVAAAPGRVVRLFTSDKGGITAYVLGTDDRTVYYYAHLDAYADGLEDGDVLQQGDPIGTVGDTGNAVPESTHLHFAIWTVDDPADFWDGETVNPYPLLTGE
ncbi:M23 family metallopeptidase [Rubrivirga sp.]|uniref:M23 family metallopeptidase n=1 Tax=Rubrivirga sp. TaxID=1885344 RepID=UPI003C7447BD